MKKQSVLSRLVGYKDAPIILLDEATASPDGIFNCFFQGNVI